jgi:transposase
VAKRKTPVRYTNALAFKAYMLSEEGKSQEKIGEILNVSKGTICKWTRKVKADPALLKQAKMRVGAKKGKSRSSGNGVDEVTNLMQENAYLRWWNLGLQEGFVDRLLEDLKR